MEKFAQERETGAVPDQYNVMWANRIGIQQLQASEGARIATMIECEDEAIADLASETALQEFKMACLKKDLELKIVTEDEVKKNVAYYELRKAENRVSTLKGTVTKAELAEELHVINSATPQEFLEAARHIVEDYHVSLKLSMLEVDVMKDDEDDLFSPQHGIKDLTGAIDLLRELFNDRLDGKREPVSLTLARESLSACLAELKEATAGLKEKESDLARQFRSMSVHFSEDVRSEMERLTTANEETLSVWDSIKTVEASRSAEMASLVEVEATARADRLSSVRASQAAQKSSEAERKAAIAKAESDRLAFEEAVAAAAAAKAKALVDEQMRADRRKEFLSIKNPRANEERRERLIQEEYSQQLVLVGEKMVREEEARVKAEEEAMAKARAMEETSTKIASASTIEAAKTAINISKKRLAANDRAVKEEEKVRRAKERHEKFEEEKAERLRQEEEEKRRIMNIVRERVEKQR